MPLIPDSVQPEIDDFARMAQVRGGCENAFRRRVERHPHAEPSRAGMAHLLRQQCPDGRFGKDFSVVATAAIQMLDR